MLHDLCDVSLFDAPFARYDGLPIAHLKLWGITIFANRTLCADPVKADKAILHI